MSQLALSASFEYLLWVYTVILNILILSVRGPSLDVRIWRLQTSDSDVLRRAARWKGYVCYTCMITLTSLWFVMWQVSSGFFNNLFPLYILCPEIQKPWEYAEMWVAVVYAVWSHGHIPHMSMRSDISYHPPPPLGQSSRWGHVTVSHDS